MLKQRIITSVILLPLFLGALFYLPQSLWSMLIIAVLSLAFWEWNEMIGYQKSVNLIAVTAFAVINLLLVSKLLPESLMLYEHAAFIGVFLASFFWVICAPIWLLMPQLRLAKLMLIALGIVILLPTLFAIVSLRSISPWLLLGILITIWIADSAAYFAGKKFGKHKLAPLISPGKTWEGVAGAFIAVSFYSLALCIVFNLNFWIVPGLLGVTILSILGDLFESLIKRQHGLKDSGKLLPGHGGVLDRIDGLLSTLPVITFFYYFPLYL